MSFKRRNMAKEPFLPSHFVLANWSVPELGVNYSTLSILPSLNYWHQERTPQWITRIFLFDVYKAHAWEKTYKIELAPNSSTNISLVKSKASVITVRSHWFCFGLFRPDLQSTYTNVCRHRHTHNLEAEIGLFSGGSEDKRKGRKTEKERERERVKEVNK